VQVCNLLFRSDKYEAIVIASHQEYNNDHGASPCMKGTYLTVVEQQQQQQQFYTNDERGADPLPTRAIIFSAGQLDFRSDKVVLM
jgi:hypothetical protein